MSLESYATEVLKTFTQILLRDGQAEAENALRFAESVILMLREKEFQQPASRAANCLLLLKTMLNSGYEHVLKEKKE